MGSRVTGQAVSAVAAADSHEVVGVAGEEAAVAPCEHVVEEEGAVVGDADGAVVAAEDGEERRMRTS